MRKLPAVAALIGSTLGLPAPLLAYEGCLQCSEELLAARRAADRAFDPVTGEDTRNFPPDVQVDFQHLSLDIDMPDPASRSFTARQTLTFKTLALPLATLRLNAVDLDVRAVTDLSGKPLPFRTDDHHLDITFPAPLPAGADAGVVISYAVSNPKDGMIFALPDKAYLNRPLHIHTQGQPESNRFWFPSHDYPNERQTTEIAITIPARYKALANGALVERRELDGQRVRYHYRLGQPHVSYLVSLVIGEFDVFTDTWRSIPLEYWVPPGTPEPDVRRTFRNTAAMLDKMSELIGVDYPYEKYAQSVVFKFSAGGMENTSTTTLTEDMILDERAGLDQDREGLIAHELAHQWFGDMLTCKSWQHIWLNEGFATYLDAVWQEHGFSREHYDYELWETMRRVAETDDVKAAGGLVFPFYEQPGDTFGRRVSNPYPKGASVLHMLRMQVGDEVFWKAIATYTRRYAWQSVETDDLRKVFDELAGRSFERFFKQWVYRPGSPHVSVSYDFDAGASEATLTLRQTQPIDEQSPAFSAEVPVWLVLSDGSVSRHVARFDGRTARLALKTPGEPVQVCVDPTGTLLAKWDMGLPTRMLATSATSGPTLTARLHAVAELATKDRDDARAALGAVLHDQKAFWGLRAEAAAALGRMRSAEARRLLVEALSEGKRIADHKVRRAVVEALGEHRHADSAAVLIPVATADPSGAVEAAATESLGRQAPSDAVIAALLANAAKPPIYRDQVRVAAARALGRLADPRGFGAAASLAAYGQPFRTRPPAIEALGEIGKASESLRPKALDLLLPMLTDPQERARNNAIAALGKLGDAGAVPELQKLADNAADPDLRRRARSAIDAIGRADGESNAVQDLRRRLELLERAREREHEGKEKQ